MFSCRLRIAKKEEEKNVFRGNPVYKKEVSTGAYTARTAVLIIGFNTVLAVITFVIFSNSLNGIKSMGAIDYSVLTNLYSVMVYIEFGIIALVVPAITAGAVVGERERQTMDVMMASRVSAITIVFGKMFACLRTIMVVCISSLPVLSIVFVYGGIRLGNLLTVLFVIICTGFYFGSIGIFISCICKRTTTAVVLTYIGVVASVFITGGIVYVVDLLYAETGIGSAGFVETVSKIMFFNPAATIVDLVGEQLETVNYFEELLFYGTVQDSRDLVEEWTAYSIVAQLILSIVLVSVSAWILNPLKFNLWRRIKRLNGKSKN